LVLKQKRAGEFISPALFVPKLRRLSIGVLKPRLRVAEHPKLGVSLHGALTLGLIFKGMGLATRSAQISISPEWSMSLRQIAAPGAIIFTIAARLPAKPVSAAVIDDNTGL
jgi:hypothetical protein